MIRKNADFAVRSLSSLIERGIKVAFIAGNRQIDKSNKNQKVKSFEKMTCNASPLLYVKGEKAVLDGCSLMDAVTGIPVPAGEESNYIVIVDGQHRFTAAQGMENKPELFLLEAYVDCDTKLLLAECNIVASPWKADNYITGAALFQPEDKLAKFANELSNKGYPTSTIGKILCFAGSKLKTSHFADIMSGKAVDIAEVNYERAARFLAAARSKFSDKFISKRYLIDVVIELQGVRGYDALFAAIERLSDVKVREITEAKATEVSSILKSVLYAMITE